MKKFTTLVIILCSLYLQGFNQISFTEHDISANASGINAISAADIDGDTDIDIISSSLYDDKVSWYENDGSEVFSEHIVSLSADMCSFSTAADLDSDNDIDIISASWGDDKIAWYENDGNQNFTEHIISTSADGAYDVITIDLDGDNDLDVVSGSANDDKVAWYENDGNQNFTEHLISTTADAVHSVFAIDLDNDSDIDVLSASFYDDQISWYENDGSQNFTHHCISGTAEYALSVFAIDMDNDTDIDVLSASFDSNEIAWYENDGNQNFAKHVISVNANRATKVFAADLDKDSDIDVFSSSWGDNKISWYENDGSQIFEEHIISANITGASSVMAIDVNSDSSTDVIASSSTDNKIIWFENCTDFVTIYQTACGSYEWNGTTYTSSATPVLVFTNSSGCDSVVTLNLTINNSVTGTDVLTKCNSYTWIDGNTYTESNNTASFNIAGGAANGCDSLVNLDLTINNIDNGVSQDGIILSSNENGAVYQWLDCEDNYNPIAGANNQSFTAVTNGSYAVRIEKNACIDTSVCIVVTAIKNNTTRFYDDLNIYPNPTQGNVIIEFKNNQEYVNIRVIGITGQVLKNETFTNTCKISLFIYETPGIYMIEILFSTGIRTIYSVKKE